MRILGSSALLCCGARGRGEGGSETSGAGTERDAAAPESAPWAGVGAKSPAQMVVPAVLDCVVGAAGKAPRDLNPAISELPRSALDIQRNDGVETKWFRRKEGVRLHK
jgi:hypothetical protein